MSQTPPIVPTRQGARIDAQIADDDSSPPMQERHKGERRSNGHPTPVTSAAVLDPTTNVIALTRAANERQDDLREANDRRLDSELRHIREMANLRETYATALNVAESNRLDSIRQVDVLAVNTAAERANAAIQTLATTAAASAENLRVQLNTTAQTIAAQLANTVAGINERLSALERSSYEAGGKRSVSDPAIDALMVQVKMLSEARAGSSGKNAGISAAWVALLGSVTLIGGLLGIGGVLFALLK